MEVRTTPARLDEAFPALGTIKRSIRMSQLTEFIAEGREMTRNILIKASALPSVGVIGW